MSKEAKDLIDSMLVVNQRKRITASAPLANNWIADPLSVAGHSHREEAVASLKKFNERRKLKGAILSTVFVNRILSNLGSAVSSDFKKKEKNMA